MRMAHLSLRFWFAALVALQTCPCGVLSWARSFKNEDECLSYYANMTVEEGSYCHTMWDGLLCWPPSPYQAVALLPCPTHNRNSRGRTAYKRCTPEGTWEDVEDPSSLNQLPSSREYRSGLPATVAPTHPCLDETEDSNTAPGVITAYSVSSRIEHRYAQTYVKATVMNTDPHPTTLPFKMTLPENAFISSLVMEIDGTNFTSSVKQKPIASRSYQVSKGRPKDPVLVEHSGMKEFKVSANIVARKVTFYIKYEEPLRRVNGHYFQKIYIRPGSRIPEAEVSIHIIGKEPIGDYRILELPGQELHGNPGAHVSETFVNAGEVRVNYRHVGPPTSTGKGVDGNFIIAFNLKSNRDGGVILRDGNYFNHFIALDANEKMPKLATHTVFAVDVSDSMGDGKLDQVKDGLKAIIKAMDATDSFEILAFSSDVATLGIFNGTHYRKALRRVKKLQPMSYSNLNMAYMQALKSASQYTRNLSPLVKQIVIITDGHPTKGIIEPAVIRRNVRDSNLNGYPIFGIGFGLDTHFSLVEQISADSRAEARHLKDRRTIAQDLEVFGKEISRPILTDFTITYPEDEVDPVSVFKNGNSNFYSGGEAIAVGRLYGVRNVHPRITGVSQTGALHLQTQQSNDPDISQSEEDMNDSVVVRLWAFVTIQNLTKQAKLSDNYPHVKRLLDQATHLALKFRFVTLVTSLVVRDATGEYEVDSAAVDFPLHLANHGPSPAYVGPPSIMRPTRKQDLAYQTFGRMQYQDPHFVVSPPGLNMPLCFDFHAHDGAYISLIRDKSSGIIVNGQTMSDIQKPKLTYITKLFIALGKVNITLTPNNMEIDCVDEDGNLKVDHVTKSLWPFYKRNGKKYKKRMADFHARPSPIHGNPQHSSSHAHEKQDVVNNTQSPGVSHQRLGSRMPPGPLVSSPLKSYPPRKLLMVDGRSQEEVHYVMNSVADDYIPHHEHRETLKRRTRNHHGLQRFSRQSGTIASGDHSSRRSTQNDHNLCSINTTWKDGAGKKYGDVMVVLYRKRNMHIMVGDGLAHFVIVRSKKDDQQYLGFYLQDEEIMSPNTQGLIGQFTSKVITVNSSIPAVQPDEKPKVELLVQRRTAKRRQRQRKARVIGTFSSRRSNPGQEHIDCIAVRQGRRLLDGKPEDYFLSCLHC
ncbi:inter-alpha-trypsin inhibitor heavy chain H2-like isoform X2 [Palaemon carinicauda]|uniref:inter-alpha-trypsin inhibitor heavy chain H2-like isoform X2 n=1 Tax=Palaemon carinicauda TaxID=392227 RepID=UPI0035B5F17B